MKRLAITLGLLGACGGHQNAAVGTGSGSAAGPAVYAKKISLGFGFQQAPSADGSGATTDVFLQTTDETGKQVSYPLGTYKGDCRAFKPAPEMKAVTGVACTMGATGVELHAVVQDETITILKLHTDAGARPDPMSREEVTHIQAPGGSAIEAGS